MSRIERVLIVKLGGISDVVRALPVAAAIKDAFPHVKLTWIAEDRAAHLLAGNPYLHDVISRGPDALRLSFWPGSWGKVWQLRRELRARKFDMALDLQGRSRSALIVWLSGAPFRFGCEWMRELFSRLITRIPRRSESVHIVDQLLDVARFLGAPVREVKFPFLIPQQDDALASALLRSQGVSPDHPFLSVNPGNGRGRKFWRVDRLVHLLDTLSRERGIPVVIVGGLGDRHLGYAVCESLKTPSANLTGGTSLPQLMAVLRRSAVHLSGDTGSAHLAAALGTPVVSVFGRTNPARFAPYGQGHLVVHRCDRCAAPCRRSNDRAWCQASQKCLAPPPSCLASVGVDEVAAMIRGVIDGAIPKSIPPPECHAPGCAASG